MGTRPSTKSVTAGIIGNLGPITTAELYKEVTRRFLADEGRYPPLIIDALPLPFSLEEDIIFFDRNEEAVLPYLIGSVARLEQSGADFIVMPCNTLHVFAGRLTRAASVPVINIIEETADLTARENVRKAGLLGTNKTVSNKLYESPLNNRGIELVLPSSSQQDDLAKAILGFLQDGPSPDIEETVSLALTEVRSRGAEAVILGCTDLQEMIDGSESDVPIIDSFEATIQAMLRELGANP